MIRQLSISLLLSLASTLAYAQAEDLPTDLAIKLDEQSQKLYPDDAREQQRWINKQKDAYLSIAYIVVNDKEDAELFKQASQKAKEIFPLDFESQIKFLNDAVDCFATITGYKSYFPAEDLPKYQALKDKVLSENPKDYKKAAKDFENASQAIIELDTIPFPEIVDKDLKSAIKGAASRKFKDDYAKQKEFLVSWSERFEALSMYEAEQRAIKEREKSNSASSRSEKLEKLTANVKNATYTVKSDQESIGYCILLQDKPVVIFPAAGFDPTSLSIANSRAEKLSISGIFASKNEAFLVAVIKNPDEDLTKLAIATTEKLKSDVEQSVAVFGKNGNSFEATANKISNIAQDRISLSRRMMRDSVSGTAVLDLNESSILGINMPVRGFDDVPDFSNKSNVKDILKSFDKEKVEKAVLRVDNLKDWDKVDTSKYVNQVEDLKSIEEKTLQFLKFLDMKSFNEMEQIEGLSDIYEKYQKGFSQLQDKGSQTRSLKNMIRDVAAEMERDVSRVKLDQLYFPLRREYEYNLAIRAAMAKYLKNAVAKDNLKPFFYKDIKVK